MRSAAVAKRGLAWLPPAVALAAVVAAALAPAAGGASRGPLAPSGLLDVPDPSLPVRDAVIEGPGAARAGATVSAQRYPVNDGKNRTVAIAVSPACNPLTCNAAQPQRIADFLGTLLHGDEITSLTVELMPSLEISGRCGLGAGACYFPDGNTMLVNGSDATGPDGASREFVIAHEYGHHLAQHRRNPPFGEAIDWGPKRWATYERVCQGVRDGIYFPGDEAGHYRQNPGEAFSEAFAFNRFRRAPVAWAWVDSLKPNRVAFRAIRRDALRPWTHRTRFLLGGRVGGGAAVKRFRTPLDGVLSVALRGRRGADLDLLLRDAEGRLLADSRRRGSAERLNFTVCGQARMRAVVVSEGRGGPFTLVVRRP